MKGKIATAIATKRDERRQSQLQREIIQMEQRNSKKEKKKGKVK